MVASPRLPNSDMFLMIMPLVILLAASLLRLETFLGTSRATRSIRPRLQPLAAKDDSAMRIDPDGRPWDHN